MTEPSGTESRLVHQARTDLAHRLRVTIEAVQLVSLQATQWPDAGLGCPEPGKVYAAVITPGYRVILAAEGKRFDYRGHGDTLRYCGEV